MTHENSLKARHFQIEDFQILNELHSDEIVVITTSGVSQTLEETKNELQAIIDHIFNDPQIDVITAGVTIDRDEASSKILLKLGFSYVGDKIFRGNGKNSRMYELRKKIWLETDNAAGTRSFQRKNSAIIAIQAIDSDSDLYQKSLDFRYKILREPLGLFWSKKDLDGEESQFHILAICDQKIVGTVVLKPVSKTRIKLRQMAVDESLQGNGIGKKLVLFAENLAKSKGFQEVEMIARMSALDFYKKLGYKTAGEEFEEVTVRSINMIKNLS